MFEAREVSKSVSGFRWGVGLGDEATLMRGVGSMDRS
jgi:hypothetical protein